MNPKYPFYIPSKGRYQRPQTARALEKMAVPYRIVIEPQEYDLYASVIDPRKILVLPFSNLGQGSIPARNWLWEHSRSEGHSKHWCIDDNIFAFSYFNHNQRNYLMTGTGFRIIEDFSDRYENLALTGMQYDFFAPRKQQHRRPLILNTRIYSCMLIDNAVRFRWRGRYNEDTDLSLRCLKAGWCTVLFNVFLAKKVATMLLKGGNTDELYRRDERFDGRLEMARSLKRQHPDVTKIAWKWGRWQHVVDYSRFKGNKLRLKPGVVIPKGVDNFGLVCKRRTAAAANE